MKFNAKLILLLLIVAVHSTTYSQSNDNYYQTILAKHTSDESLSKEWKKIKKYCKNQKFEKAEKYALKKSTKKGNDIYIILAEQFFLAGKIKIDEENIKSAIDLYTKSITYFNMGANEVPVPVFEELGESYISSSVIQKKHEDRKRDIQNSYDLFKKTFNEDLLSKYSKYFLSQNLLEYSKTKDKVLLSSMFSTCQNIESIDNYIDPCTIVAEKMVSDYKPNKKADFYEDLILLYDKMNVSDKVDQFNIILVEYYIEESKSPKKALKYLNKVASIKDDLHKEYVKRIDLKILNSCEKFDKLLSYRRDLPYLSEEIYNRAIVLIKSPSNVESLYSLYPEHIEEIAEKASTVYIGKYQEEEFFKLFKNTIFFKSMENCLPYGIKLIGQGDVDTFKEDYPSCKEIGGELVLTQEFKNLSALSNLTKVGGLSIEHFGKPDIDELMNLKEINGNLKVYGTKLADLDGFKNLVSISGSLKIYSNSYLSDISALANLNHVGGQIEIDGSDEIKEINICNNIEFCEGIEIDNVENVMGFNKLTSVKNDLLIRDVKSINGFNILKEVGGKLVIKKNACDLDIIGFDNLKTSGGLDLRGIKTVRFNAMDSVRGYVQVYICNPANNQPDFGLKNLKFIENNFTVSWSGSHEKGNTVKVIKGFNQLNYIGEDCSIPDCFEFNWLNNLETIDGHLGLGDIKIISGFNGLRKVKRLTIHSDVEVVSGFRLLEKVEKLEIHGRDLNKISGFNNLKEIGKLTMTKNIKLSSLDCFKSLDKIEGEVKIKDNGNLPNVFSLKQLKKLYSTGYTKNKEFDLPQIKKTTMYIPKKGDIACAMLKCIGNGKYTVPVKVKLLRVLPNDKIEFEILEDDFVITRFNMYQPCGKYYREKKYTAQKNRFFRNEEEVDTKEMEKLGLNLDAKKIRL